MRDERPLSLAALQQQRWPINGSLGPFADLVYLGGLRTFAAVYLEVR